MEVHKLVWSSGALKAHEGVSSRRFAVVEVGETLELCEWNTRKDPKTMTSSDWIDWMSCEDRNFAICWSGALGQCKGLAVGGWVALP